MAFFSHEKAQNSQNIISAGGLGMEVWLSFWGRWKC
jgi:hypothetical protein